MSGIVLAVIRLPDPVASAGESLSENKHLLGAQCSAGRIVGGGGEVLFFPTTCEFKVRGRRELSLAIQVRQLSRQCILHRLRYWKARENGIF